MSNRRGGGFARLRRNGVSGSGYRRKVIMARDAGWTLRRYWSRW